MSEKIQVVVQLKKSERVIRFEYQTGLPFFACLSEKLTQEGVAFSLCGGKGICGKCRVRFISAAPLPTNAERQFLSAEELRQGIRLACLTKPAKDCEIEVLFEQDTTVVTEFEHVSDGIANEKNRVANSDVDKISDAEVSAIKDYVITADVGTTTIAMSLIDVCTGKVIKTYSCMNPQSVYGADVIARITAAEEVGADKLQKLVLDALIEGATQLKSWFPAVVREGQFKVHTIYVAANTVMNHFLAGSDAAGLGAAPFEPEFLESREVESEGYKFVLVPGISAFVGGDIVAGLLSCGVLPIREENRGTLFIDLGTNGEMALCDGTVVYCTAAAAGPAFEGKDSQKRGSHSVHILAELLRSGRMDETGLLQKVSACEANEITEQSEHELTQKEIRDLQMAKAAVRTGIEVLLQKAGMSVSDVKCVYLAGGFGYYIQVEDAVEIGLLPADFKEITVSVGNASLHGAVVYARLAQSGESEKMEKSIRENCIAVNLGEEEYFIENYIEQMNF